MKIEDCIAKKCNNGISYTPFRKGWLMVAKAGDWYRTWYLPGAIFDPAHDDLRTEARSVLLAWQYAPMLGQPMTPIELRAIRAALGMTQAGLGRALDLTRVTVCLYENGRAAIPRVVQLAVEALVTRERTARRRKRA